MYTEIYAVTKNICDNEHFDINDMFLKDRIKSLTKSFILRWDSMFIAPITLLRSRLGNLSINEEKEDFKKILLNVNELTLKYYKSMFYSIRDIKNTLGDIPDNKYLVIELYTTGINLFKGEGEAVYSFKKVEEIINDLDLIIDNLTKDISDIKNSFEVK